MYRFGGVGIVYIMDLHMSCKEFLDVLPRTEVVCHPVLRVCATLSTAHFLPPLGHRGNGCHPDVVRRRGWVGSTGDSPYLTNS